MLFWAVDAAVSSPAPHPLQLLLGGLAVVMAALLIVAAAAGMRRPTVPGPVAWRMAARRAVSWHRSRVADPDAAGRPRPRAPSAYPTAA